MPVATGGVSVATALSCAATLRGRKLRPSAHSLRGGTVRCVWKIPVAAHRKRFGGSVVVRTAYDTAGRRFSGIVR
jgi:hypothetical protein